MKRIKESISLILAGIIVSAVCLFLRYNNFRHWLTNLMIVLGGISVFCGILLIIFSIARKKRLKPHEETLETIDKMSGIEFEEYLIALFTESCYTVQNTKKSHDYGADLLLRDETRNIVVQAKRYSGKISISAVQECAAARAHYKADEAWLITNSYFTQSALDLALTNSVRLLSRNELSELVKEFRDSVHNAI